MTHPSEQDLERIIIVEDHEYEANATKNSLVSKGVLPDQIWILTPNIFAEMEAFPPKLNVILTDGLKGKWEMVVDKVRLVFEGNPNPPQLFLLTATPNDYRAQAEKRSVEILDKFDFRQLSAVFATIARQLAESDEGTSQQ